MPYRIPLFQPVLDESETEATRKVIESAWLSPGERVAEFEAKFAELIGCKHAIAVSSGTAALHLSNLALGIGANDHVVTPSITFVAGPNSIIACGAQPSFADSTNLTCPHIGIDEIKKAITPDTRAIHVTHYAGYACDMDRIMTLADQKGLPVIEDCAHSPGAKHKGTSCGNWGILGCFSFFPNKNITTAEGGMITTNEDQLADKLRLLKSHGVKRHDIDYDVLYNGYNYRMDEIRAAIGIQQLKKLESINRQRNLLAQQYQKNLNRIPNACWPSYPTAEGSVDHIAVVALAEGIDKNEIRAQLKRDGVETSFHYPPSHKFTVFKETHMKIELPNAEKLAKSFLTIPRLLNSTFSSFNRLLSVSTMATKHM